jgi:Mce-associated membrane protein
MGSDETDIDSSVTDGDSVVMDAESTAIEVDSTASEESITTSAARSARRRASRAAGPASEDVGPAALGMTLESPLTTRSWVSRAAAPPRRQPTRGKVAVIGFAVLAVIAIALGVTVGVFVKEQDAADATQRRDDMFVDTAKQTVVNMFSYTQNTIDASVDRFYNGISGPLRDMMAQGNNRDNLKAIFRQTQADSEAVVSGAALEKVDEIAKNATVLVAVRVTVTDLDGVNAPSKPYRLRVIVHEADDGNMTGYDLKYPDGGN